MCLSSYGLVGQDEGMWCSSLVGSANTQGLQFRWYPMSWWMAVGAFVFCLVSIAVGGYFYHVLPPGYETVKAV